MNAMFKSTSSLLSKRGLLCRVDRRIPRGLLASNGNNSMMHSARPMSTMLDTMQHRRPHHLSDRSNVLSVPHRCNFFSSMSAKDIQKRLDEFQDLFVEARLCIEDVEESVGTKYFDEDAEAAQAAVDEAVAAFEQLISDIDDADEKNRVLRGNGLKVEQLKGELDLTLKGGHDH